ncbi:MAG: hypothetical protein C4329_03940 [Chitinophagaceae bacterium]
MTIGFGGCKAQSSVIKRGYAFYKPINYGAQMRDLDGKPVNRKDTSYFLYLETKAGAKPEIHSVLFEGKLFTAGVFPVQGSKVEVGKLMNDQKVWITKQSGNSMWLVELHPAEGVVKHKGSSKNITVVGTINKKTFQFKLTKAIALQGDIMG